MDVNVMSGEQEDVREENVAGMGKNRSCGQVRGERKAATCRRLQEEACRYCLYARVHPRPGDERDRLLCAVFRVCKL